MKSEYPRMNENCHANGVINQKVIRRLILQSILLWFCSALCAQEELVPVYHFERLFSVGGLSPREIRAGIVRDSTGYVWIGMGDALQRYDGYSFRQYCNDPADPTSISSNTIMSLLVESKKRLWLETWRTGLSLYSEL